MSSRRRSDESAASESRGSSAERSPAPRQTSIRVAGSSGRSRSGGQVGRVTIARSNTSTGSATGAARQRSSRTRRPTPVSRRTTSTRRRVSETDAAGELSGETTADEPMETPLTTSGRGRGRRVSSRSAAMQIMVADDDQVRLSWYDRLMPDFLLNLTAPITGYESRLDSDVDDDEFEILERQRLKRNRRVRRRLLTLMLIATATTAFLYSRGRLFRRAGVRAAASTLKQRIEGGLAKSMQDTMGK